MTAEPSSWKASATSKPPTSANSPAALSTGALTSTPIIFAGRFDYPLDTPTGTVVEDNRTFSESDWIGTRLSYRFDVHAPRHLDRRRRRHHRSARLPGFHRRRARPHGLREYRQARPNPGVLPARRKAAIPPLEPEPGSPLRSLHLSQELHVAARRFDLPAHLSVVLQIPVRPQLPQSQQLPVVLWRWLLSHRQSRLASRKREYCRNRRGTKTGPPHESGRHRLQLLAEQLPRKRINRCRLISGAKPR